ncbi:protein kinase domain-containing protein, partial [Bradyrhizobium guangdongense]|uniref:protein kinase domain-containing protein n=1 Tax=Bradyrhizobium guangdongense TaxID=1325090 RepID=UPI00131A07CC
MEGTTRDKEASCPSCGKPINIAPLLEQRAVEKYTLKNAVGRGYYGITFHAENQIGRSYAVKLVPARIYEKHDKSFSEEIRKYNKLGSHPHIADLVDAGEVNFTVLEVEMLFHFIVMEWIEGETLTQYTKESAAPCNEVYGAILDITSGLERFESQNLWHNDLNSDNILFKRLTSEERRTRRVDTPFICKIVDVGSAVFRQAPIEGRIRDLAFLGHHINDLRKQSLKSEHQLTREDIFFLNSLEKIVARLLDEDQTRGFATAAEVSQEVSDLYQQRYLLTEPTAIDLDDPFAYLNANDFPNDTYINYLFSDRFPWVRDIVTPEAQGTLITGPRGSGKTMILRSMRLKTRLHPFEQSESVESIRQRVQTDYQLAFYVSARIEIGNQCSLSKLPRWAASEELTVYYFLLLYTVEILETLFYGSAKSILRYDSSAEVSFCKLICTSLCLSEHPTIQNVLREVKSRQYEIERDSLESTPPGAMLNSN